MGSAMRKAVRSDTRSPGDGPEPGTRAAPWVRLRRETRAHTFPVRRAQLPFRGCSAPGRGRVSLETRGPAGPGFQSPFLCGSSLLLVEADVQTVPRRGQIL